MAGALLAAARLRGSFSASKCKTEARMAAARMKLLRNRRDAQLRKMRGDVAALLRDGRDDTARIRGWALCMERSHVTIWCLERNMVGKLFPSAVMMIIRHQQVLI
nr:uncharacterized protein LOC127310258 [Lolium perenne]